MASVCRELAQACVVALGSLRESGSCSVSELQARMSELTELTHLLDSELQGGTTELVADSLEQELQAMDKAIEEAALRIEVCVVFQRVTTDVLIRDGSIPRTNSRFRAD